MKTRTGGFPIGFRRGGSQWQKDLGALIAWAKEAGFEAIDLGKDGDRTAKAMTAAGLRVGSVDLPEWQGMISPDKAKRADAVARNTQYVKDCTAAGAKSFFLVCLPEDRDRKRAENFAFLVESFAELVPALEAEGARLVIEGWPGPGALCCTPEGFAALFREVASDAMEINYDPSHLVRMGIDPLRFLRDFAERIGHVHGKDTELLAERQYELGTEQPATFAAGLAFGGTHWRYCIPGHGCVRWVEAFRILEQARYDGCVCVELEDMNFNGSEPGEKQGLAFGGRFLESC